MVGGGREGFRYVAGTSTLGPNTRDGNDYALRYNKYRGAALVGILGQDTVNAKADRGRGRQVAMASVGRLFPDAHYERYSHTHPSGSHSRGTCTTMAPRLRRSKLRGKGEHFLSKDDLYKQCLAFQDLVKQIDQFAKQL
jgi:hypothetical protein